VSTEKQADKVSPEAQEADCRALAEKQGYTVVAVYRDVEKYRVGGKLVEPSGTRADRPGLRQMLADARADKFDVILAWREDRLYRSYRPMLDVLDCLEETGLDIELAKENFDKNLAPVKAWAARMELNAKHDRVQMGVAGRLKQGKAWSGTRYGYARSGDSWVENKDESDTVRLVWRWYADGETRGEIRRRLIASGAKQRGNPRKYPWSLCVINGILTFDGYYTGFTEITWNGDVHKIPVPVIVDADIAERVKERRARYKTYPAGNLKAQALAAGIVYCKVCGTKMAVVGQSDKKRNTRTYVYYACINCIVCHNHVEGCAQRVVLHKIDAEVWGKLWDLISVPGNLEAAIEKRVAELREQEVDASAECKELQDKLDELAMMRQEAIALHQKKIITEADLSLRLTSLSFEQVETESKLRDARLLVDNHTEELLEVARVYREGVLNSSEDYLFFAQNSRALAEFYGAREQLFSHTFLGGIVGVRFQPE
jgi:site-specific DNA recombinase